MSTISIKQIRLQIKIKQCIYLTIKILICKQSIFSIKFVNQVKIKTNNIKNKTRYFNIKITQFRDLKIGVVDMDMQNFNKVFNSDGTVKLCGRENCKKLIKEADTLEPGIQHGNIESGYMDIKSIKRLYKANKKG